MSRKSSRTLAARARALTQRREGGQYPPRTVLGRRKARLPEGDTRKWDEHPSVWVAFDYWTLRHDFCGGCEGCDSLRRVKGLRAAYRRRQR